MCLISIDPLVDFACHLLLGSPDHPQITIHFLNAILSPVQPITKVRILNPILGKDFDEDKLSILDILATDNLDRVFNVEVQRSISIGLAKRLTYYSASLLVEQIGEGDGYQLLLPSIGICILDGQLFPDVPQFHHDFLLRSSAGLALTDCLQIHLLELPKYPLTSDNRKPSGSKNQWFHFFRRAYGANPSILLEELQDPIFAEALDVLEMIQRSPDERRFYESRLKFQRDEQARLDYAGQEGEIRGEIRGKVATLQEVLGLPISAKSELDSLSTNELDALLRDLQTRLRTRMSTS